MKNIFLPINMVESDRWLYEKYSSTITPINEFKVLRIRDAYYQPSSGLVWVDGGKKCLDESCIVKFKNPIPGFNYGSLSENEKRSAKIISEPVGVYSPPWYNNYYHFWIDGIGRLIFLRSLKDKIKILDIDPTKNEHKRKILNLLGFNDIFYVDYHSYYLLNELYLPCYKDYYRDNNCHPIVINQLRDFFLKTVEGNINIGEKILIKRKDIRVDEKTSQNLLEVARELGYVDIYCEDYTIEEQIKIFKNVKIVLGVHGAGMTNILWSEYKKGLIIELLVENDAYSVYFFNIAKAIGFHYAYIPCKFVRERTDFINPFHPIRHSGFNVFSFHDKKKLKEKIMEIEEKYYSLI